MIYTVYKVIKWPPNIVIAQRAWKNLPLAGRRNIQRGTWPGQFTSWGRLDQLRGWPPGWFSWSSEVNDVKLMNGETWWLNVNMVHFLDQQEKVATSGGDLTTLRGGHRLIQKDEFMMMIHTPKEKYYYCYFGWQKGAISIKTGGTQV